MRLVFVALFVAESLHAADPCPWLNDATASGYLATRVAATFTPAEKNKDDGNCSFSSKQESGGPALRIVVSTMADPKKEFAAFAARCGSNGTPLQAIGNEALACRLQGKQDQIVEQVVGRVRDRAFTISLTMAEHPTKIPDARTAAHDIAEMVAGNLF